ncbi:MAG: DUF2225 domain-containing protein [Planctomycetaceae bacterium]|nr:DUF2225 domain-containing protein [Planctomycetaceae bacterium]
MIRAHRLHLVIFLTLCFFPGRLLSQDAGALSLRPGEPWPQPQQRGLNQIHELPTQQIACPVCTYPVAVPQVDLLMRRRPSQRDVALPWRMHFTHRDDDLCPYPGKDKLAYQADIVVCPSCGYTNHNSYFADPLPEGGAEWVRTTLTPSLHNAETALLGNRASEMREDEVFEFFNRQDAIPDSLRLEHYRTYLAAVHAAPLAQARAAWLAAWAARREVAGAPKGEFLAKYYAQAQAELAKQGRRNPGLQGDITALRGIIRRAKQAQRADALPGAQDMGHRLLLASLWDRMGFLDESETILMGLYHELRERFLRHDQDPLWSATNSRASQSQRLDELETMRTDAENEVFVRVELVRRERMLLEEAAGHLRRAITGGAFDNNPDDARFHAYLLGEFLRRSGDLPLASEWFKNLASLTPEGSPLAVAAVRQLEHVGEEAGDKVNLLSALGRDGILFEKLREICAP